MDIVNDTPALRTAIGKIKTQGGRIAFVPTMGALHEGHLKLVRHARAIADHVVASIFVNPMQFGPKEDYDSYPLTLELDRQALEEADADLLFVPGVDDIYPHGLKHTTCVVVPELNAILEGEHRPSHFNGVTTVVARLFNLVQPDIAVFGEKDYQQLLIVKRMVEELCMPVTIEAVVTVREPNGLAMSSRNRYLHETERGIAPQLYQTLLDTKAVIEAGEQDLAGIEKAAVQQLAEAGFQPDYVSIRRQHDLQSPDPEDCDLVVLAAARLGATRLIDNISLSRT